MKGRIRAGIVLLMVLVMTVPAFGMTVNVGNTENAEHEYARDRIIVKFAENATAAEKMSIRAANNLETKRKFKMGAEAMMVHGNRSVEDLVEVLNKMDAVEYAELDYILTIPENEINGFPDDPYDSSDWYLWGMDNIDAPGAWSVEQGRPEVIVAVIDTGIDYKHIELDGNMWINEAEANGIEGIDDNSEANIYPYIDDIYGWDYVNDDADPFDDNSHGTHVAGTIAAEANGAGVVGVAPNVKVMALKCFDADGYGSSTGFSSDVAAAIEYADEKGANIINASWGGGNYSTTIKGAIEAFDGVFVAAAGNDSVDTNPLEDPHYPSSYDCSNIISVASIDEDNYMSDFSNYGTESVDLFAPGGNIWSVHPGDYSGDDPIYYLSEKSGTSMATPHVSGVLALMISHEMNINEIGVDSDLLRSPELLINDVMESAIYDEYYAQYVKSGGRLNAYEALQLTPVIETNTAPENTAAPVISPLTDGKVQTGIELTADYGGWVEHDQGQTLSYDCQWQISTSNSESGIYDYASGSTYTLDSTYNGDYIRIEVTATDDGYPSESTVATSIWYEIQNIAPVNTSLPEITPYELVGDVKTVEAGTELTASTGVWEDNPNQTITYAYEWEKLVGETVEIIVDETDELYTPDASDTGNQIRVKVTASDDKDPAGADYQYSDWYEIVAEPVVNYAPVNTAAPTITGGVVFGSSLANIEFDPGTWTDEDVDTLTFEIVEWQTSLNKRSINYRSVDYILGDKDKYVRIGVRASDKEGLTSDIVYSEWYKTLESASEPTPDPDPTPDPEPSATLEVVSTTPEDGSKNISRKSTITTVTVEFNMDISNVAYEGILLNGNAIDADNSEGYINYSEKTLTVTTSTPDRSTTYTVTILADSVTATATDGSALSNSEITITFKTANN